MKTALLRSRLALGLSPTPRPGLVLLPLGMALGPAGLSVLTPPIAAYLDPAISVALATLGVMAGFGLDLRRPREGRLLAAASIESGLTAVLVAASVLIASAFLRVPDLSLVMAIMFGLSAAVSSTAPSAALERPGDLATRFGDLDGVLPVVVSAGIFALLRQPDPAAALLLVAQSSLVVLLATLAGRILVAHASTESEEHVFVAGTLFLLGGTAAYLALSALWIGFLCGWAWRFAGGVALERLERDLRFLQPSLIVLLLIVAGARLQLSPATIGISAVYLVSRLIGKLAGGWLGRALIAPELPADIGRRLLAPGAMAVAFAVNILQTDAEAAPLLLAVAVIGTLGSELFSMAGSPGPRRQGPQ